MSVTGRPAKRLRHLALKVYGPGHVRDWLLEAADALDADRPPPPNFGMRERGEEALRQASERGERGKTPSLLTMLGHDAVLAADYIEALDGLICEWEASAEVGWSRSLEIGESRLVLAALVAAKQQLADAEALSK